MRLTRMAGLALVPALLLASGCGVASTQFHPGIAAEVGDGSVSNNDVNDSTRAYCHYLVNDGSVLSTPIPLAQLRAAIAGQLALVEAAKQVAEERGLKTGKIYQQSIAQNQTDPALKGLDKDETDDVEALNTSNSYVGDIINALGAQVVQDSGKALPSDPTKAAAVTSDAGKLALESWIKSHHVEIDPRYDVELQGVTAVPVDQGISFAESAIAKAGVPSTVAPSPDVVAALPASERCGGGGTAPLPSDTPLPVQ